MLPFLRWAGGKRKLAELITDCLPTNTFLDSSINFYEPFVGGGAIMLHLGDAGSEHYIPGNRIHINDMNPDLVITYQIIQRDVENLIIQLDNLSKDLSKEAYLKIRAVVPDDPVERAARFIYLNKTGFNGLWRVNNKGLYNVPWGQLKNPTIYAKQNLLECSGRLIGAEITHLNFSDALAQTKAGDMVYFDPPYIPLTASSSFSKYAKNDFSLENQIELKNNIMDLTSRKVNVILSNSDTPETRKIFGECLNLYQIDAARAISAKASSRGKVKEILGYNYSLDDSVKKTAEKMTQLTFI